MYRRHISQLRPGQVLARSLYTERGDVLLGAGAVLNPFYISRLEHRGVISVFLRDVTSKNITAEIQPLLGVTPSQIDYMQNAVGRYPFDLYGYCLMTNHFHLVIQTRGGGSLVVHPLAPDRA